MSEFTSEKEKLLKNEANARSLGKTKVAYSRRGEENDTLVLRDLSEHTRFDRFGVKGVQEIERIYYVMLNELKKKRENLVKGMRFGGDTRLCEMLDGLSEEDLEGMRAALEKTDDQTRVVIKDFSGYYKLELLRFSEEKLMNGIYFFTEEVVKLVKHINTVFKFSDSECLQLKDDLEKYKDDFFF